MSSLAPDQGACERTAGPRAILDIGLLCERDGFQKQRAQAGQAMAGGMADWNEGVPVVGERTDYRFVRVANRTMSLAIILS